MRCNKNWYIIAVIISSVFPALSLSLVYFFRVCVRLWILIWEGERERERERKEKKEVRREEKNAIKFSPSLVHLGFIAKMKMEAMG